MRAARQSQHQSDGGIGDVFRAIIRYIDDRYSLLPGRQTIHIINADAAADDHFALFQPPNRFGSERQKMINHQARRILDPIPKLLLSPSSQRPYLRQFTEDFLFHPQIIPNEISDINARASSHAPNLASCLRNEESKNSTKI